MIGMQPSSNNLQGIFGSSRCKKDGTFTLNEPISVLDTRSPSPSTSTSTFTSFNNTNPQGNTVMNEPAAAAARRGGGGKEEWAAADTVYNGGLGLSHGVCENGFEDEILKLQEAQGIVGFEAIDKSSELTAIIGNAFSSYNMPTLGLSGSGSFPLGKFGLDSNSLLIDTNNGDNLQSLAPYVAFQEEFDPLGQTLDPVLVRNAANLKVTNLNPLFFGTEREQQNQVHPQSVGNVTSNFGSVSIKVPFCDPGHQLSPVKQQQHLALRGVAVSELRPQVGLLDEQVRDNLPQMQQPQLHEMPLVVPKIEPTGGCSELMGVNNIHLHLHLQQQQKQVVYDQVYKAAESIQAGNLSNAQAILARLNHVVAPLVRRKAFLRSAFYVKEALELAITMLPPKIPAPFDGMFKMCAYKLFSEVSPVIQFMNFTADQIILEALGETQQIHIIDFDIGFGAHWSSFLQELNREVVTSVKITAFASPSTHHSLEISLMHENLTRFANELGIHFELEVVNIDSFDPNCNSVSSLRTSKNETIAVNFPVWSFMGYLSVLPSFLCLIKKLRPKIMVSLGCGCERIDLPFSHHILHTLEYYEALLGSVDAANVSCDAFDKIEKFLFQPRIESTVLGRLMYPDVMPTWRNLFASVGYSPLPISNFGEIQAECMLRRMQVRGFRVERQHASLLLCWQRCELLSVSAWSC